jgi:transcriptional regulator with XRE-family HTH domain
MQTASSFKPQSELDFAMVETSSLTLRESLDLIERDLGLSEFELASALGVAVSNIQRWRCGEAAPNQATNQRLDQLVALHRHLFESIEPEDVAGWLRCTPVYLGGITPADAIANGQADRVEALLTIIDYGIFT